MAGSRAEGAGDAAKGTKELPEWMLKDLAARFLLSATEEEQASTLRMLFLAERAHWFYQDHCQPSDPSLPRKTLRQFSKLLLSCDGLSQHLHHFSSAFDSFMQYKKQVPSCGAVILHASLSHVLMVCHTNSKAWSFPRGKRARHESYAACAAREVLEETGCDISGLLDEDTSEFFEADIGGRTVRLYGVAGIDMPSSQLGARTMGEIGSVAWLPLSKIKALTRGRKPELHDGGKLVNVAPFAPAICKWAQRLKKQSKKAAVNENGHSQKQDGKNHDRGPKKKGEQQNQQYEEEHWQIKKPGSPPRENGKDAGDDDHFDYEDAEYTQDYQQMVEDERDELSSDADAMLEYGGGDKLVYAVRLMGQRAHRALEPLAHFRLNL